MPEVSKTFSLQRAYFRDGFNGDFESILKEIFKRKDNMKDRIVGIDLVSNMLFASLKQSDSPPGIYVRILKFETGAIGIINLDTTDVEAVVEEFSHPDKRGFLKDEIVLFVVGNNIVACNLKNSATSLSQAISKLNTDYGGDDASLIRIADVPDRKELEQIERYGVKCVNFNISSYMANIEFINNNSDSRGAKLIKKIFSIPSKSADIRKRANSIGNIRLSRGRFMAHEKEKDEWLTQIGLDVLDDSSVDSFQIDLENGAKISNDRLKKTKKVKLPKHANSYSFDHAVLQLSKYYVELERDGTLRG